ncbi:MAG: type I polyketide synthase, partial [bacterium]|nr:type I polyketide synthase [bacterium]
DAAAGIAGFVKTVLALKHRTIPPTLHFKTPNPKINLENSPFEINTEAVEWKNENGPLRAGVSSFGVGGTNAHIILEEPPEEKQTHTHQTGKNNHSLLLLSAENETSLNRLSRNLAEHIKKNPGINLADIVYTLQIGRKPLKYRRRWVCSSCDEAIEKLSALPPKKILHAEKKKKSIVFMFAGLGSQYTGMGLDLYREEPLFKKEMERCFKAAEPHIDFDMKKNLYPEETESGGEDGLAAIHRFEMAQLTIFST